MQPQILSSYIPQNNSNLISKSVNPELKIDNNSLFYNRLQTFFEKFNRFKEMWHVIIVCKIGKQHMNWNKELYFPGDKKVS